VVVIVLTVVPPGLRGHLTRWLLEIAPGVFVGHASARVRDLLWERVVEYSGQGRALMVVSSRSEQRLAFRVHEHDWQQEDFDGLTLMRRRPPKPMATFARQASTDEPRPISVSGVKPSSGSPSISFQLMADTPVEP